jgi:quercetin dioxygenase-like cupin family protein
MGGLSGAGPVGLDAAGRLGGGPPDGADVVAAQVDGQGVLGDVDGDGAPGSAVGRPARRTPGQVTGVPSDQPGSRLRARVACGLCAPARSSGLDVGLVGGGCVVRGMYGLAGPADGAVPAEPHHQGDATQRLEPYRHLGHNPREAGMSTTEGHSHPSGAVQQAPGLWRTDLQRHDLSVPGREVVQQRVDVGPETPLVRHAHPGEEIIYVLEGSLEYQIEGQPPRMCNAGDALTVPAGAVHAVRNVGSGNAAELATYVVDKGKPLLTLAE